MSTEIPPAGRDAGAGSTLQILATEHLSLLATRTLTYNEALSRVTIFLAILSGALIALALVAQADHFGAIFISIAIPLLALVMFAGIITISRLTVLNGDDYRWVIGMNRLRHAYVELHPELEQYFVASPYDDLPGAADIWHRYNSRSTAGFDIPRALDPARDADRDRRRRRGCHRGPWRSSPGHSTLGHRAGGCCCLRARPGVDGNLEPEVNQALATEPRAQIPLASPLDFAEVP
jgi:hypothetical protein